MAIKGSELNIFISKTKAQIEALAESITGAIYFASDTPDIYIGNGGAADKYSGIVFATSRPSSPREGQLYFIGSAGGYVIETYVDGAWETATVAVDIAAAIHAASSKATLADADEFGLADSAASWALKKHTWANLKTNIASFFISLSNLITTWATPTDSQVPSAKLVKDSLDANDNDHINSAAYDTGTDILTLTKKGGGQITVYIPVVDAPLTPMGNWNASAAPTVNDDSLDGYGVGSNWYDVTHDDAYVCLDASAGAAVWVQTNAYDLGFALSDETSDLTTDNDAEIEIIRAQEIQSITLYVNTAPTGSSVICEIYKNATLIETVTLPTSSTTVTVTNTTSLAVGDRVQADITQIGSTVAGAGAKIAIKSKLL